MKRLALLATLGLSALVAHAQTANDTVIDRANQPGLPPAQPPGAPTADGEGIVEQTDSEDAGVQRLAEPRGLPFKLTLSADSQVYYTNNVQLADDSSPSSNSDAIVLGNTLSVRLSGNPITAGEGLLTPAVGVVYQNFRHGIGSDDTSRKNLDFDAYSLPLSLTYRFGEGWEATAGVTAGAVYRIHGAGDYKRIVGSYTPSVSLRKLFPISQEQVLVVSGSLSRSFTKATRDSVLLGLAPYRDDRNDKLDAALDVTHYILKGNWIFTPYARVAYADYAHYEEAAFVAPVSVDRDDWTLSAGFVTTYKINDWFSARAFVGYEVRDSESGPFTYSYESASVGVGVSGSISF